MTGRIFAGLLLAAALIPAPALAQSSIAIGQPADKAAGGVTFGVWAGAQTHDRADVEALRLCRTTEGSSKQAHNMCTVVARYDNQCVSFAMDPRAGTYGFGWAVFPTQALADRVALANCRASARDQRNFCVISLRHCDGSAAM